jgi:hypothetical protein
MSLKPATLALATAIRPVDSTMIEKSKRERLMLSIPGPLLSWVKELAAENCTSQNAEISRSIRERRERMEAERRA